MCLSHLGWALHHASEAKKLQGVNKVYFFKGRVSQCAIVLIPKMLAA